jgi:hypothetical protein
VARYGSVRCSMSGTVLSPKYLVRTRMIEKCEGKPEEGPPNTAPVLFAREQVDSTSQSCRSTEGGLLAIDQENGDSPASEERRDRPS